VFGYGSLISRPDFAYLARRRARLRGRQRRFWQGSHDHRGFPERPGRVVTLLPTGTGHCDGMAYLLEAETAAATFDALDHREKNGYERHAVSLDLLGPREATQAVPALVYIAATGNHAYLGPAPVQDMARQIAHSQGPSGRNIDYLLELADALRRIRADDPHVFELEAAARNLTMEPQQ
jgi:cation transport regulator ChaC